jgi:hypothetical protein
MPMHSRDLSQAQANVSSTSSNSAVEVIALSDNRVSPLVAPVSIVARTWQSAQALVRLDDCEQFLRPRTAGGVCRRLEMPRRAGLY